MKDHVLRDRPWTFSALSSSQMFRMPVAGPKLAGLGGAPTGAEGAKPGPPRSEEYKEVDLALRFLGAKAEVPEMQRAKRVNFIVDLMMTVFSVIPL